MMEASIEKQRESTNPSKEEGGGGMVRSEKKEGESEHKHVYEVTSVCSARNTDDEAAAPVSEEEEEKQEEQEEEEEDETFNGRSGAHLEEKDVENDISDDDEDNDQDEDEDEDEDDGKKLIFIVSLLFAGVLGLARLRRSIVHRVRRSRSSTSSSSGDAEKRVVTTKNAWSTGQRDNVEEDSEEERLVRELSVARALNVTLSAEKESLVEELGEAHALVTKANHGEKKRERERQRDSIHVLVHLCEFKS